MVGCSDYPYLRLYSSLNPATPIVHFTEMYLASTYANSPTYRSQSITPRSLGPRTVIQFAATSPETFLEAALQAQKNGFGGVDLNLGCPQSRAREGGYGSYMAESWDLCLAVLSLAVDCDDLRIPVCVKIRIQEPKDGRTGGERTIQFVGLISDLGVDMITIHGRVRGTDDDRRFGAADLGVVKRCVEEVQRRGGKTKVISNGNVRGVGDVGRNLEYTGADGIMVGEELLRKPDLFGRYAQGLGEGGEEERKVKIVKAYLEMLEGLEGGEGMRLEDGSKSGKNGGMIRGVVDEGEEEFERMSVWWTNLEVVKSHFRWILADRGDRGSKRNFAKTKKVLDVIKGVKKRFGLA
ncbi:hypothetical protein TrRE_jg3206 [Triparma retinervis]|uniref:tRNA-dihydrouridine(16/17) synthase [NAD(P)(+)] n=1 Tax=Triparma retinervis TaxID=2557542 RepID=A0A9W7E2G7_9STRA|nr:hypothetical protein TrRE_jg3206 [Triparma retinervis]